ncbi:MAG: hypothetical protein M1837_004155 [Sclerophora amabilis]|nr:MAG: hypothetical protein M1837_004155 [Sclerophora amabilis]
MYWPLSAPQIYAANNVGSSGTPTTFEDDVTSSSYSHPQEEDSLEVRERASANDNDQANSIHTIPTGGGKQIEEPTLPTEPPKSTHQETEHNGAIIGLRMSRSGHMFATITTNRLTLWQTRPTAVLAVVVRSIRSLKTYGPNVSLLLRPDSAIFVVQTSLGYLITYSLATDPTARVYKPQFINSSTGHSRRQSINSLRSQVGGERVLWGAGEGGGVREVSVRFRMVIRVDAGICRALALDDELVVATQKPAAVQCIRWTPDNTGNQTHTELLSRMNWISKKSSICEMVYDRAMNLSAWLTSDGKAYAVQRQSKPLPGRDPSQRAMLEGRDTSQKLFQGYCFHDPTSDEENAVKTAINAKFSLLAVGCANGHIYVYTARDYVGSIPLSHKIKLDVSSSSSGLITFLNYSPDGYCLFAGFERGWMTWSVFGQPIESSFTCDRKNAESHDETWLTGLRDGAWLPGGSGIMLMGPNDDRIWILEMARSSVTTCFSSSNISRSLLQTNSGFMLYRGSELSTFDALSAESSLWHTVQIPSSYLVDQWPIRCVVISSDGRYVAVAGRRGLAHYSVNSGRWKTFVNENMENDFVVKGGMCWHQHILIAAVESGDRFELRLYSRELALDNSMLLHIEELRAPIVLISSSGEDSLLVYTYDNVLYHYIITLTSETVVLIQVGQIGFHGIVRAPARVRAMSWVLPDDQLQDGDPSKDVTVASVLFLIDGKLVLLQPSTTATGELKYEMRVMMQNVEFYALTRDQPIALPSETLNYQNNGQVHGNTTSHGLGDSLWVFDGNKMRVWTDIQDVLRATSADFGRDIPEPATILVDFYPLSVQLEKGILLGAESELIQRRDANFSFFKLTTRTHLFLPSVLRHQLAQYDSSAALHLSHHYQQLPYFAHALEILLHDVLDEEVDKVPAKETALLPSVVAFLSSFPQYLDIVVQCTRKTEVRSWKTLFAYLPPPQELFEESLQKGLLKTAGGYLLVLHTFDELGSKSKHLVRLLSKAKDAQDWELCKELARFLMALDETGATLRSALEDVDLSTSRSRREPNGLTESPSSTFNVTEVKMPLRFRSSEGGTPSHQSIPGGLSESVADQGKASD